MYEAINKGINLASGDIIGLLHSDDIFYDNHVISDIINEFNKHKNVEILYGDGLFVDSRNLNKVVRRWIGGKYSLFRVKHGWLPLHPTCYIKKELFAHPKPYNEHYKIAADTDFLLRLLLRKDINVHYLQRYIVKMRMGGLSTDRKRRKQMWQEDVAIFKSLGFPISSNN